MELLRVSLVKGGLARPFNANQAVFSRVLPDGVQRLVNPPSR